MAPAKSKPAKPKDAQGVTGSAWQLDLFVEQSAGFSSPVQSLTPVTQTSVAATASVGALQAFEKAPFKQIRSSLTIHEKGLARTIFKNMILSANNVVFEKLFTKIWTYAYPDFRQVKPQGSKGDKKNDGYHTDTGEYYQVYGPENSSQSITKALKKLERDFSGLKAYWDRICPVRAYRFVFNDKYDGTYPELEGACARLKAAHGLKDCRIVTAAEVENTLFSRLTEDQIISVIGFIPNPDLVKGIDYNGLREVIEHLLHRLNPSSLATSPLIVPDFEEKLAFNALSPLYASYLRAGNRHNGELDAYFVSHGDFQRHEIHRIFRNLYRSARDGIQEAEGALTRSDRIFLHIYENAMPRNQRSLSIETAVFTLMAYYFETCDIFEEPMRGQ